jgi:hypothetical protein
MASSSSSQEDLHFQSTSQAQLSSRPERAPLVNWRSFRAPLASSDTPYQRYDTPSEGYRPLQTVSHTGFSSEPQTPQSTSTSPLQRTHSRSEDIDHNAQKIVAVCAASSQQVRKEQISITRPPHRHRMTMRCTHPVCCHHAGQLRGRSPFGGWDVCCQGVAAKPVFRGRATYVQPTDPPTTHWLTRF